MCLHLECVIDWDLLVLHQRFFSCCVRWSMYINTGSTVTFPVLSIHREDQSRTDDCVFAQRSACVSNSHVAKKKITFLHLIFFQNSQPLSATSPSTTDGEFSSSLLSCPMNGQSSSTSDLDRSHHPPNPSSTLAALTTLTRKSPRHFPMKNVSFQPTSINPTNNIFNDLFQNTSSTFSTLPKLSKRDLSIPTQSNDFPTLQTILQPPPLLNGILLLDQMLTRSSIDEPNTSNSTVSGKMNDQWYNVTCNYQTRASIV